MLLFLSVVERVLRDGLVVRFWETDTPYSMFKHVFTNEAWIAPLFGKAETAPDVETDVGRYRAFCLIGLHDKLLGQVFERIFLSKSTLDLYYPILTSNKQQQQQPLIRSVDVQDVLQGLLLMAQSLRMSLDTRRANLDVLVLNAADGNESNSTTTTTTTTTSNSTTTTTTTTSSPNVPQQQHAATTTATALLANFPEHTNIRNSIDDSVKTRSRKAKKRITVASIESPDKANLSQPSSMQSNGGLNSNSVVESDNKDINNDSNSNDNNSTINNGNVTSTCSMDLYHETVVFFPHTALHIDTFDTTPLTPLTNKLVFPIEGDLDEDGANDNSYDSDVPRILGQSPTISPWTGMPSLEERKKSRSSLQWRDGLLVRVSSPVDLQQPQQQQQQQGEQGFVQEEQDANLDEVGCCFVMTSFALLTRAYSRKI
jgi:hypothetical protein